MKLIQDNVFAALRRLAPPRRIFSAVLITASVVAASVAFELHPPGSRFAKEEDANDPDALRPDHVEEAIRFRNLQLQDEKHQIPADGLLKAKAHIKVMQKAQAKRAAAAGKPNGMEVARLQADDWVSVGPGNVGGRVRSIVIDPNNRNRIWLGSVGGGIWFSSNAGDSWAPVNDFMANLAVSTLAINPTNPNVLYAGTGELFAVTGAEGQDIANNGLRGSGVFKSNDGGVTWAQLPATNPADPAVCATAGVNCTWSYVNRVAVSPDGTTILAATADGVWRSVDAGTSWTRGMVLSGFFMDVDFDPTNSQRAITSGSGYAAYSVNRGQNWTTSTFSPAVSGRIEVAYAPSNPGIVYASVNNNGGDIYRSTNGGQSFVRVRTGGYLSQGNYANIIWVNPQDPNFIIVGGLDLWRSTDGGMTLTQISRWQCGPPTDACDGPSAHADHHMIVADTGFNNTTNLRVYFSNDGGIYRAENVQTVDQTDGWTSLNHSLAITQFYSGTLTAGQVLIGGAQDNGNQRADSNNSFTPPWDPQDWKEPPGADGDGGFVAADPNDSGYVYAEYVKLQLSRSTNGGASFTGISSGIADAANGANFVAPFILDPSNSNRMLAGGLSLWRTNNLKSDDGPTWSAIKNPAPTPAPGASPKPSQPISAIAVSSTNADLIVVGHNDGEIFLTSNGTAAQPHWDPINVAPLPARFVTRLVFDDTRNPKWIYATFGGFSPDNVYVSKNLGASWQDITGSGATALPDVPVRSLAIHPARPDFIYVGTEVGIFASEDAGATWQLPQGGPSNVSVDDLFWSNGYLTAATHGRGMFITHTPQFLSPATCVPTGLCSQNPDCTGYWDCSCTWPAGKVPGPNDDVVITCPVAVRGNNAVTVKNLRVEANGRLDLGGNTALFLSDGLLTNYGTIDGGYELRAHDIVSTGNISTYRVWALGSIYNSGILTASADWTSDRRYPIEANGITVEGFDPNANSLHGIGSIGAVGVLDKGYLVIGPYGKLQVTSTSTTGFAQPALYVWGDVNVAGLLDVRGEMTFLPQSQTFTGDHTVSGAGQWKLGALSIGDRYDGTNAPGTGAPANILLAGDVTLDVAGLADYGTSSFVIASRSNVLLNGHALTINSPSILSYGRFDLGGGALNLNIANIKTTTATPSRQDHLAGFTGSGSVNLIATGTSSLDLGSQVFQPTFHVATGTVDAVMGTPISGPVKIDTGAILNLNRGSLTMLNDLRVDGTIGKTSAASVHSVFAFFGNKITNNGSIAGDNFTFNYGTDAVAKTQILAGFGAWPAANSVKIGFSTAAPTILLLANDIEVNWNNLAIFADSKIDTGEDTLTMPCGATFDTSSTLYSGEIVGSVQRRNIADCNGNPIPFTSRYTTVRFDSGTAPNDVTIYNAPATTPFGFPTAVKRKYQIIADGGSGYSATLRLHYNDSELNGNSESTLSLWRDGGTWAAQGASARDTDANWVELSGVTEFSLWALASCATSISPDSSSVRGGGGTGSFQVFSTGGCGWTAMSNASWITITSGASGTANGAVQFTAAALNGPQRSGTITVTGSGTTSTFTVTQTPDCSTLNISPGSANLTFAGGSARSFNVTAGDCGWLPTSDSPWIAITYYTGSGNGSVYYDVGYNDSGAQRSGTISVGDKTFIVTQGAAGPGSTFTVTNTNNSGAGSLRQAILDSNAHTGGRNTIDFILSGPTTIIPQSDLPEVNNPVIIDGISSDGRRVTLDGSSSPYSNGLYLTAPGCVIRGFIVTNFSYGTALELEGGSAEVENCYIGTNPEGSTGLGNGYGIAMYASFNRIGGSAPGLGNVIASCRYPGIYIGADNNLIENNYIGTNAAGANLGNGYDQYNLSSGVEVNGARNAILSNRIAFNARIGIDLNSDGVTPNDLPETYNGANHGQNFPVLSTTVGSSVVHVDLTSAPNAIFTVQLFANGSCDSSGFGEGQTYLGDFKVSTNTSGQAAFSFELPRSVTTGNSLTATATDSSGNTSEFSACLEVTPLRIESITRLGTGEMQLKGVGVPNEQHTVEILATPNGTDVIGTASVTADAQGQWQYTDADAGTSSIRFYRLRYP